MTGRRIAQQVQLGGSGQDPSVNVSTLEEARVDGRHVRYVGKASANASGRRGVAKRLDKYWRHGAGKAVGHWGGRYIWQLDCSDDLLVAWLETPGVDAEAVES